MKRTNVTYFINDEALNIKMESYELTPMFNLETEFKLK